MKNVNKFVSLEDDETSVELSDIVMPLPEPIVVHCSERQNYFCTFYVNLDDMNVS
jgi:hypothetical protein